MLYCYGWADKGCHGDFIIKLMITMATDQIIMPAAAKITDQCWGPCPILPPDLCNASYAIAFTIGCCGLCGGEL